jgi:L-fuconolactonase
MHVDAHHHVWDPATADYPWMTDELAVIRRRFAPADLAPDLAAAGIDATILVQTRSSVEETVEFLGLTSTTPSIVGVVGWVDLSSHDVAATLRRLSESAGGDRLVGIRHQVHDEPDPDWLRRPDVRRGLGAVGDHGLAYDLLLRPRELPAAIDTVAALPGVRFVVDHLAKPEIAAGGWEPWASDLGRLAERPNVWCKVSGLVTEADWSRWTADAIGPYVDHAFRSFGADRLLFGSDWPVCLLAASYQQVVELARELLPADRATTDRIFGGTAIDVYRLVV